MKILLFLAFTLVMLLMRLQKNTFDGDWQDRL